MDIDERQNLAKMRIWLVESYSIPALAWDPEDYGGMTGHYTTLDYYIESRVLYPNYESFHSQEVFWYFLAGQMEKLSFGKTNGKRNEKTLNGKQGPLLNKQFDPRTGANPAGAPLSVDSRHCVPGGVQHRARREHATGHLPGRNSD